ncbi:MAG: ROK family glucokinase [Epulopiscium sp.]|nr:ROK family glucokinase [Candidatus Epulonipiscium sp.]
MYYIGIDLGGTNIAAAIVTEEGKIIRKDSIPTLREREYSEILKDMANLCLRLMEEEGLETKDIHSIGIGSPGTADPQNGILLYANNLKFKNVPMRTEMQKYISVPVYLDNDANCAALGESVSGAARHYGDSVTVTLGTGVGGGIIVDGKIITGSFHGGGELGHHVIKMDGDRCNCGRLGCWEVYASATALIRDARVAAAKNPKSLLLTLVDGDIQKMNAKIPFDAAAQGDEIAQEVVAQYIRYLAVGMVNIINIFQPEAIVIGGGVSAQGENLLVPLREEIQRQIYGEDQLQTKLVTAELGNDAGIIGAAMLSKIYK